MKKLAIAIALLGIFVVLIDGRHVLIPDDHVLAVQPCEYQGKETHCLVAIDKEGNAHGGAPIEAIAGMVAEPCKKGKGI